MSALDDALTDPWREEREALRDVARRALESHGGRDRVRALLDDPVGYDEQLWKLAVELGWTGLGVPEAYGGTGGGAAHQAVVLEELGYHLTALPLLSMMLAAGALLLGGDDDQRSRWLPALVSGTTLATAALCGPDGRPGPDRLGVEAEPDGDGLVLRGEAGFVTDAHVADLLVVATRQGPLALVEAGTAGLTVTPTPTVDRTRRLARVALDDVTVGRDALLEGEGIRDRLLDHAAFAVAADAVGGAGKALGMAVEYAGQRVQFGRVIGSFQAVKHKCADMLLVTEASRAALEVAVAALDGGGEAGPRVAIAKSYATDAYARVAGDCVQVHGGIGFTWEHDAHLFLKRAKLDQALFGDPAWHRDRVATHALAGGE